MKVRRFFLFLTVFTLFAFLARAEVVEFPTVEPTGSMPVNYGWGYDTHRQSFKSICVTYDRNSTLKSGSPYYHSFFKFAQSTSEVKDDLKLSVDASLKILGATTYKASDKLNLVQGTKTCTFNQSLYAGVLDYKKPIFLDLGTVSLKPEFAQLVREGKMGEFRQKCGDAFVIGIQEGREFLGTATIKKQTLKSWTKFANELNVSAKGAWGNASMGTKLATALEKSFGSSQIEVNTYSTGSSMLNPTNIEELVEYYKKFHTTNGETKTVKYIIASYSILPNYPLQNPLNQNTKETYMATLITSLWDLKSGIEDANYVISRETQELFALGTNPNIRRKHISYVRAYRDTWQKEFDKLLKATKQCNKHFTKKCEMLAKYYKRYRNFIDEWDAVMPQKYLSDCKTPIRLPKDAFANIASGIQKIQQRVHGDSEGGGGKSKTRIVVVMRIMPDGRLLKAQLSLARIEWKRPHSKGFPIEARMKGESAWGLFVKAPIFDLDNPFAYGVRVESNLKYCTYNRATGGIKTPIVRNIPPAAPYFARLGFKTRRSTANGYIDEMTGRGPRGDQTFANGKGVLDYIVCEADRKGSDDRLTCKEIGFKQVELDLVSVQDLQANKWRPPKRPTVPAQLEAFFYNKPIILRKRIMRTYGTMSPGAVKWQHRRTLYIKSIGRVKVNLPNLRLKKINIRHMPIHN